MKRPPVRPPKFDSLGRRPRHIAVSTGKRIHLNDRIPLWCKIPHYHGPIPSSYLLAYDALAHPSKTPSEARAKERLRDLFHEDNTPHGGTYLSRPWQQWRAFSSLDNLDDKSVQCVYDITPRSRRLLRDCGSWREHVPTRTNNWLHDFNLSCITASIELATLARPDQYRYIHHHEILEKIGGSLLFPLPSIRFQFPNSKKWSVIKGKFEPDRIIGIEYLKTGKMRILIIEGDRNTEPNRSEDFVRKSYRKSLLQYRQFYRKKLYKKYFGADDLSVTTLHITTNVTNMYTIMTIGQEITGGNPLKNQAFKVLPVGEYYIKPPNPMPELFTKPYNRSGMEPLSLV